VLPPKAIHNARLLNLSLSRGFVLLFVLAATAWAVDPNRQITQYAHTSWRIQDGFFNDVPTSVTQTTRYTVLRGSRYDAFRHAQAGHIETEITYGESLRLRFRDDGKGIDPSVVERGGRSGHWGLPGIRERAKQIGAELSVWSELGAGTEVELSIPGSITYEASPRPRFRLLRKKTEQDHEHRS
jgi:signal transduction histidine kinase